jgi:hypothetical protein
MIQETAAPTTIPHISCGTPLRWPTPHAPFPPGSRIRVGLRPVSSKIRGRAVEGILHKLFWRQFPRLKESA